MVYWFLTRMLTRFNVGKAVNSTNSARTTVSPHIEEWIWIVTGYIKVYSKMDQWPKYKS